MLSFVNWLLRVLPPETAPSMGLRLLRVFTLRVNSGGEVFRVKTRFSVLDNPIDLAAGYDKGAFV